MKMAAIYCRVSTEDQEREGTSLQTQLEGCLKYCESKGYVVARQYSEAYSGLDLQRPKLDELRELVRAGAVGVVVVHCLDRLSRDPTHGVILTQEMERHGVTLEAVIETVDSTELGKLISYIRGYASKVEAEKIRERTTRGKGAHVRMGRLPIGTGRGLYGYRWDKKAKKRVPLEYEVKVVEKVFGMLGTGEGNSTIARALNDQGIPTRTGKQWSPVDIRRMSINPAYIGMTYYGRTRGSSKTKLVRQPESQWQLLPDVTPPIIDRDLFARVQERQRQSRELHHGRAKHEYLLRGHAVCGHCGSPLVGSFMNHRFRYYHCRATYPTASRAKSCSARYIRADMLEDAAWQSIRKVLEHPELVMAAVTQQLDAEKAAADAGSLAREIQTLKKRIRDYEPQEKRLIQLLRYGEINPDNVLDELAKLKREREADQQQVAGYLSTREHLRDLENAEARLHDCCQRLHRYLNDSTMDEKRDTLEMLAIKVTATADRVDIAGVIPLEPTQSDAASPCLLTTVQTSA